jgi:O-antigen/teichoic acid export membrane protein
VTREDPPLAATAPAARSYALARAGAVVGPAMAVANLLQYALQLTASRRLAPDEFGAFGALLGLAVLGAVPMLALQTVAARHVALRRGDDEARRREVARLVRISLRLGVGISAAALVASPLIALFLHVSVVAAGFLALSLGPLAVAGTAQGVLQGRERFAALSALFFAVSALRVAGGVLALSLSPSVESALLGNAIGALVASALGLVWVRREGGASAYGIAPMGFAKELRHAASGVLAVLALGGIDLLLARHVLPGGESGRYAAGGLVARGCFWAPQFVAILVVPRVTTGDPRVVRRALLFVAGLGLVEVAVGLLVPPAVVGLAFGDRYRSLAHLLALYAVAGALLALLQLLLQAGIASGGSRVGRYAWGAVAAEVVVALVVRPGLVGLVLLAVSAIAGATALALGDALRRSRP